MANYISKLVATVQTQQAELDAKQDAIVLFKHHLMSDKFQGVEDDGSRKDWISVTDVLNWLRVIELSEGEVNAT